MIIVKNLKFLCCHWTYIQKWDVQATIRRDKNVQRAFSMSYHNTALYTTKQDGWFLISSMVYGITMKVPPPPVFVSKVFKQMNWRTALYTTESVALIIKKKTKRSPMMDLPSIHTTVIHTTVNCTRSKIIHTINVSIPIKLP